ncbi:MAG: hypothetical protein JSW27_22395 [Phycisphaerales bacterium]|nr:MAG: hypothetical protein JSW27_22395 [Phycisphaerales bacterium]
MRKGWPVLAWVSVALWAPGCIVIHTEEDAPYRPRAAGPPSAAMQEINAVRKLSFDSDRAERYAQIARREGLSERTQIYLIEAVLKHLAFENAKVDVLLALAGNPSFTPGARAALLERLDRLAFEHDKRAILEALEG